MTITLRCPPPPPDGDRDTAIDLEPFALTGVVCQVCGYPDCDCEGEMLVNEFEPSDLVSA